MYCGKTVGLRMKPQKIPVLTGNPCKEFPEKTTRSHLLFKNKEIRPPA